LGGAIAAGSEATAEAGAEVLRAGGTAVDAAVAACLATAAGEPTLTSLAGGGVLLHRDAQDGRVQVCDFFANAPGLGGVLPPNLDFRGVDLHFGPAIQRFHVGAGAAAVPGVLPGLWEAWERWGRLPLGEVVRPACRLLREGVELGPWQAEMFRVLGPILSLTEEGRAQFSAGGRLLHEGDRFRLPGLADTLESLAHGNWRATYRAVVLEPVARCFGPLVGGGISPQDLNTYEVCFREPLRFTYRHATIFVNPPPAAGGSLVALMLRVLESEPLDRLESGGPEHLHALCRAMWVADEARSAGGAAAALADLPRWVARYRALAGTRLSRAPQSPGGPGSTTHVSVVDDEGNAAAVTFSHGEGCGILIPGTGIMMNNLMGEEDLFPAGFHRWPAGTRLATMMSPTLVEDRDGSFTVLGSGGANRIRTALVQVVSQLVDHGRALSDAVAAPRAHFEGGVLHAETPDRPQAAAFLDHLGARQVIRFERRHLFFGGVHAVRRGPGGELAGTGDGRRGGAYRVVPTREFTVT
jgi:gamma-glutamyltranspeptidase/glutathione hydrolase